MHAVLAHARTAGTRLVLDADALNLVANLDWQIPEQSIITPHPGEAARLLGSTNSAVQADRPAALAALVEKLGCTVVLKGAGTLVGGGSEPAAVCLAGNPWLATPGSGDVLTGIVASCYARGLTARQAAQAGVFLHARAADRLIAARPGVVFAGELTDWLWPL